MNTSQTAGAYLSEEQFDARLLVDGSYVHIVAKTLADLVKTVAQLRPTEAASMTSVGEAISTATKAEPKKEAAAQVEKSAAAVSTPATSAPPAEAKTDEAARPTYDDIKKAVLALAKISSDTAKATLAKFTGQNGQPCDHGTKLKLEDYPAFLAAADEQLKVAA